MCQCFFKSMKILVIFINVLFAIIGLVLLGGGIFAKTQVNFKKIIGDEYKKNVPPAQLFVGGFKGDPESDARAKEINDYVLDKLDVISQSALIAVDVLIIFGAFLAGICIIGIIAFSCCNKNWCFLLAFLVMILIMFAFLLVLTILSTQKKMMQDQMISILDSVATKSDPPNRFFMAMIQYAVDCCGVRGVVDYACAGTYDYKCNPGCLTFNEIWNSMFNTIPGSPPICVKTKKAVAKCKNYAKMNPKPPQDVNYTLDNCDTQLNIPSPIDASQSAQCQGYKESYDMKGNTARSFSFEDSDPALIYLAPQNPTIHGSLYFDDSKTANKFYGKSLNKKGCAYTLWTKAPIETILFYVFISFLVITLILFLEIILVIWSFVIVHKEKKAAKEAA